MLTEPTREKLLELRLGAFATAWEQQQQDAETERRDLLEVVEDHPHQGVCGRHGTEDPWVTPGGLTRFLGGAGESDSISRKAKWEAMPGEQSDR